MNSQNPQKNKQAWSAVSWLDQGEAGAGAVVSNTSQMEDARHPVRRKGKVSDSLRVPLFESRGT